MLILRSLERGPQYGFAIARSIRVKSGGTIQPYSGSLYPAIQRLIAQALIVSEGEQVDGRRGPKYYRITTLGRKRSALLQARWNQMVEAIASIMVRKK